MSREEIINYMQLSDTLLTSGQPDEDDFHVLSEAGVQTIINLAMPTSDFALPNEAELVRNLGMQHIHIPVVWEAPARSDLDRFMDTIESLKEQKILVHCALNYRVSCFVALWRVLRQGWSIVEAFKPLLSIWDPADYPVWEQFIAENLNK